MTHYIDVADMQQLVLHHGVARMMAEMAECIREDFMRWGGSNQSPRTATAFGVVADVATTGYPTLVKGAFNIVRAASIRGAVRGADIVTTVTADESNATILTDDLVEPGMHINAVDSDCVGKTELQPSILLRSKASVEYEPQTRVEGELQQMPDDFQTHALWQVLAGQRPGCDNAEQVTLFDSVGFALEDLSALRYIHALSAKLGIGSTVDLVPALRQAA